MRPLAKMSVDGFDAIDQTLGKMGRPMIQKIVEAGAKADDTEWRKNIKLGGHIRNSDMLDSVSPSEYREFLGGGQMNVYPQEYDRKGVANALKAYVINYGRGKRTAKMGDKFITGRQQQFEEAVDRAMQAESDRIIDEINR